MERSSCITGSYSLLEVMELFSESEQQVEKHVGFRMCPLTLSDPLDPQIPYLQNMHGNNTYERDNVH